MVPSFDPELNMIYIGTSVTLAPDIATIRARAGGPKARQQRNLFFDMHRRRAVRFLVAPDRPSHP
jgi:hypothetical protein